MKLAHQHRHVEKHQVIYKRQSCSGSNNHISILGLVDARRCGNELVAQCRLCADEGHDRHQDNLRIKLDGSVFCCVYGGTGQVHKGRDIMQALRISNGG